MIEAVRNPMRTAFSAFGDGLLAMVHEPESEDAIAASWLVAETLILHRLWLESHWKK